MVSDKCRADAPPGQDDFHGKNGIRGQFTGKIGSLRRKIHWTFGKTAQFGATSPRDPNAQLRRRDDQRDTLTSHANP
jgi:hypothetical protein